MTGLELLEAMAAGELPPAPIADTLGFALESVADGKASFALDPGDHHYNPLGTVHGGVIATLLDSATGCAVHTTLKADETYTTLELKVNYVGALRSDTGRVIAEGTVLHRGGRTATAEGRLYVVDTGKLIAHATCTCLIVS